MKNYNQVCLVGILLATSTLTSWQLNGENANENIRMTKNWRKTYFGLKIKILYFIGAKKIFNPKKL